MNDQLQLMHYCLRLADTSLILGQRLGEWCGHGPILEEDIALTNIALDLVGQSRAFYSYAAELEGKGRTEDDFAYFRDEREFRNALLAEQPNGDFAQTILRQFLLSAFQYYQYTELSKSSDEKLAALAAKSLKEITYHLRHSSEWMQRLGDGTEESLSRLKNALDALWRFSGDLFNSDTLEKDLAAKSFAVDASTLRKEWEKKVKEIFQLSNLAMPENAFMLSGSREGRHTEHLGHMLAELQSLARSHPGAEW